MTPNPSTEEVVGRTPLGDAIDAMLADPRDGWARGRFIRALVARSKPARALLPVAEGE